MSEQRVTVTVADHVATVTMVRGEKHNALDAHMFTGLVDAAAQVAADPSVRVVVLHGEGKSFCSGLDVASFMGGDSPITMDQLMDRGERGRSNLAQQACTDWIDLPVPVIAAIQGNCFGGGMQIALGADIRIAAPDAKLSIMEIKWGLIPDMGITQTLPRLMPIDRAKELTYTGRQVSGEEAAALGLVTRTAPDPLAAAQELAAEIAGKSPSAIQLGKRLYDATWTTQDMDAALVLETDLQLELIGKPNQMAAITATLSKQPGVYEDPARPEPANA
ncbi:crotonase/enoyl-CoA hydratase family protein [Paraconexibacter antarcticus]|uniref:Crotonase/enoyl-CoA hydratase family protein n=1 Tax=Paraconexibacter antarcticus TaxID=2949664 RepID=A0ABY5DW43_9ACTN|nr:crotonase/enoyl-CoA hydratase family protein [Paraconexibacter antarcticus]UTI64764.1 crotonase/enoyl-CoA hydratase family protein [Paraconexibacter antarcticus]